MNESTWENLFTFIKETKLQEIQWKIIHNIFPTNILLNRMGIKDSEKCEFCGEKDHIEHYFFECVNIAKLWPEIKQIITIETKIIFELNEKIILFGIEQDIKSNELTAREIRFINNIILIGKLSIIKSKIENINVILIFEKEMRLRIRKLREAV